jgi:hypothetical protein
MIQVPGLAGGVKSFYDIGPCLHLIQTHLTAHNACAHVIKSFFLRH